MSLPASLRLGNLNDTAAFRQKASVSSFIGLVLLSILTTGDVRAADIPTTVAFTSPGFTFAHSKVQLFRAGAWHGPIFYPPRASAETLAYAEMLRSHLLKMGGISLDLVEYNSIDAPRAGFRVGLDSEWAPSSDGDYLRRQKADYVIVSRGGSVRIHGRSPAALRNAIWRFLELLGYRQFFPTPTWEYVPSASDFSVKLGIAETNNLSREQLLGGLNTKDLVENKAALADWRMKNRLDMGAPIQEYQMWYKLVTQDEVYQEEFAADLERDSPQLVSPTGNKLCVLNPRVLDIMYEYLGRQIDQHPDFVSYSVSAGDTPDGWDYPCSAEESQMTPSQRQLHLANEMQARINAEPVDSKYYGKSVAFLAYGRISNDPGSPPFGSVPAGGMTFAAASNFIEGGLTAPQVVLNYLERMPLGNASGSTSPGSLGYYDYLGTHYYTRSIPTQGKIGTQTKWDDILRNIHAVLTLAPPGTGKYISGESNVSFGAAGAGYYTLAKLLAPPYRSSTNFAAEIPLIMDDFISKAFGSAAAEPMSGYFALTTAVDGQTKMMSTDLLHRMYEFLGAARTLAAESPLEKARIDDLVLYTRALELAFAAANQTLGSRGESLWSLSQYLYRIRLKMMYDFYSFFDAGVFPELGSELAARCTAFGANLNGATIVNKAKDCDPPWSEAPFDDDEVAAFVTNGLAANPLFDFTPVYYSMADLNITSAFDADTRGRTGESGDPPLNQDGFRPTSGTHDWLLRTKADQTVFTLRLKASCQPGIPCETYGGTVQLYQTDLDAGADIFIEAFSVEANGIEGSHDFVVSPSTLYKLKVLNTTSQVTQHLAWDKTKYHVVTVPQQGAAWYLKGNNYYYFYIPKNVDTLVVYLGVAGSKIYRPDDTMVFELAASASQQYVQVTVDEADRGKTWKLYCQGTGVTTNGCYLLNVPAQVARSPREMLIQQSLIAEDSLEQ